MLILQKYGFKVCVILFVFYSTQYNVYIHIPCINTQQQTTATFDITHVISSRDLTTLRQYQGFYNWQTTAPFDITHVILYSNRRTPRLYQGSANCCERDHNSNMISLLQPYQTIHYCKHSVLAIVPDLNILVWSISILISFWEVPWYSAFLLCASYLYNFTRIMF